MNVTITEAAAREGALLTIRAGMEAWVRERMLPRLVPIGPEELADLSRAGRIAILRRLLSALRGERVRGRSGHWSYSLDRHIGLVQAVAAERAALLEATGERFPPGGGHMARGVPGQKETAAPPEGTRRLQNDPVRRDQRATRRRC